MMREAITPLNQLLLQHAHLRPGGQSPLLFSPHRLRQRAQLHRVPPKV